MILSRSVKRYERNHRAHRENISSLCTENPLELHLGNPNCKKYYICGSPVKYTELLTILLFHRANLCVSFSQNP